MDLKGLDYHCPRCHATTGSDRDPCPACQSALPPTVSPWPTFQAHDGGVEPPPNASALDNAANVKNPVYNPTHPTPDAISKTHRLDLTTQPPPTLIGGNGIQRVRDRPYKFIHHSGPSSVDTARTTRACLSCYNSVRCRSGPNPDCCRPCEGRNRYCRGPLHAPVLIDVQSWFETALASLQSKCGPLETIVKERSMYSLSIKVNKTGAIESYDVDLQSVDDHAATPYHPSSLVRVLDVVFPADEKASLDAANLASRPNPDDNIESVVRCFVACSMLLCTPALSKFDRSQCEHATAPFVILEFVRRIGHEACNLFQCIFHEADEFANLKPRNKATFVRDKRSFAFDLGLVHCSIQSLVSAKSNWTDSYFMPGNLYDLMPTVLEKLEWLAMGFNKTAFVDGRRCLRSELTELHIGFSSLEGRTSISDSSTQASSPGDNIVSNVPRTNSPITQNSAVEIPGQLSHSSLLQSSAQDVVENRPESPWLARELERFYENDLDDVLRSPVQERSLQEDVIRQAKTELKHHNSAINKHLIKKAALEEKAKSWVLDSGVASNIVDSNEGAVDPFRTEPAIEKRILELDEASKRQDLAIQKHNTKKAALERGMELWQRNLGRESAQNGISNYHPQSSMAPPNVVHSLSQNKFALGENCMAPPKVVHSSSQANFALGKSCHARYSESPRHYRESSRYNGYSNSSRYASIPSPYFSGSSRCNDYSDSCRCPSGSSRTQATSRLDEHRRNTDSHTAYAHSYERHRASEASMDVMLESFARVDINWTVCSRVPI